MVNKSCTVLYEQLTMVNHETQIPQLVQQAIFENNHELIPTPVTAYMQKVVTSNGHLKISAVLPELNMSERQFQQKFLNSFGITPKHYLDLCKFNYSKALLEKEGQMSLSAIAQWSGYCDQSHFIRHFKRFSGRSPKVLRKEDIGMGKYFGMYQKRAAGF
jgi:AraC-like DNA-binding protein